MIFFSPPLKKKIKTSGFSVLEVLVAMSILSVTLIAIYQSFSTSLFILNSTNNLWKAMNYSQKELLCWERTLRANVSYVQGKFDDNFSPGTSPLCSKYEDEGMYGFRWEREITDTYPLQGSLSEESLIVLSGTKGKMFTRIMRKLMSNPTKLDFKIFRYPGFSLIELLVSIALLSLIVTVLYGAFFQISEYSIKVKKSLQARQELRLLMKIVLDDLQAVQFLAHYVERREANSSFETGIVSNQVNGPEEEKINYIHFHANIPSRFYPEAIENDPELHEVGYTLELEQETNRWQFKRREDYYIDDDIFNGGKEHVLSESITLFQLEFLVSSVQLSTGGFLEKWGYTWNSNERKCLSPSSPCLPKAARLKMTIIGEDEVPVTETLDINLCTPPCDDEVF